MLHDDDKSSSSRVKLAQKREVELGIHLVDGGSPELRSESFDLIFLQ